MHVDGPWTIAKSHNFILCRHATIKFCHFLYTLTCRTKSERRRNFIGLQAEECKDLSGLYYLLPFQRGYLVNWDTQRQIWDHIFNEVMSINPSEHNLVFTEPLFNFPSIQDTLEEIFFEEYRFASVLCCPAPTLSALHHSHLHPDSLCCLVVDSGYSFTHIVPFYKGKVVLSAVRRIDVGGKLLTNHLKEAVSYRQLHVLDETYVMNQVKEEVCFVSQDLYGDMRTAQLKGPANTILTEYVLPDFTSLKQGFVRETCIGKMASDEQCLRLTNECFAIPELLFHPSDIGINQMGIPEAIVNSVSSTPKQMHPYLYTNIVATGGNTRFSGFQQRMYSDTRKLVPDMFNLDISHPGDPVSFAWEGGAMAARGEVSWPSQVAPVSLSEYKEHGHTICHKRFRETTEWADPSKQS